MNSILSNRQEGNSRDTSAFRFPFAEEERDYSQLPLSQLQMQTKVLNRTTFKDMKVEALKEEHAGSEEARNVSGGTDEDDDEEDERDAKDPRNLTETFVAVIAQGILSVPSKRMTLSSIYNFIAKRFPHFDKEKGPGWRNSVRHNLSSNDCFVKTSRAENGKGHYWMIHPKDLPEFSKGNYRRPRKPRRPRCNHPLGYTTDRSMLSLSLSGNLLPYHRNTSASLDLAKPHPSSEPFPHPFGVSPSRYDYYPCAKDSNLYPLNQFHRFSSPPPPYGLFWQDNSAFRNYNTHFQPSTFHPYLYMSSVPQSDNAMGINYA